jgi:C-terminal processing protease CtpA/Prc
LYGKYNRKKILIDFNKYKNEEIGITLTNNTNGPGVKIKKVIQDKLAYKNNLKKGDIILFINNIPCINHKQSIETLENLSLSYKIVKLILL